MTILPLIAVALLGGLLAWATRNAGRAGTPIGLLALVAVLALVVLMPDLPADASLADEPVAMPLYARQFLGFAASCGLLLALLAAVMPRAHGEADGPIANRDANPGPSFLLFTGFATLALAIVSPVAALLPAAVAALGGLTAVGRLAVASRPRGGRTDEVLAEAEGRVSSRRLGMEVLRIAIGLAATVIALGLLTGLTDPVAGARVGVGSAFLALALAVALRLGTVPLHAHATRLVEGTARTALPVLAVWGPALFALAVLAGLEAAVTPLDLPLAFERGIIAGLAVLTIAGGALGALVQDDIDHIVAYSILQDTGVALLAFAAADPSAWGPARAWLLILPLAKSALLAWALATGRTFGTRSLVELRGWVRRAPLLAGALAVLTIATVGVPGFVAYDARLALIQGAFSEPIRTIVFATSLTTLLVAARLFVVGLGRPTARVAEAPDERLRRAVPNLRRRVGATARLTVDLNRAPLAATLTLALAVLALGAGVGLAGLRAAAGADLPAPLPGMQPTTNPGPTFQPVITDPLTQPALPSPSPGG